MHTVLSFVYGDIFKKRMEITKIYGSDVDLCTIVT